MRDITVTLGGQDYAIQSKTHKQNRVWRERLAQPVGALTGLLANAEGIELNSAQDLVGVLDLLKDTVIGSIDTIFDLLCDYAPAVAADRGRIEEEAYDEEILTAFVEVVKLVYPFGILARLIPSGRPSKRTSTSSRSPSGASKPPKT
jgi:hypothetical protein